MAIKHGVYIYEQPTSIIAPVQVDSAVQVAVGTAPVNLGDADDALSVKVAYSYDEAVRKLGYSRDLMTYTLCQTIKASFEINSVCPVVFINVLDPRRHVRSAQETAVPLARRRGVVAREGILLDSLTVAMESGGTPLVPETDYAAHFDSDGYLEIRALDGGAIPEETTQLYVHYRQLDPGAVDKDDILAGIRKISDVYPKFNLVPGTLLCAGWTHIPEIYMALTGKTENLNGMFKCMALCDIDAAEADSYEKCNEYKNRHGMTSIHSELYWPLAKIGEDVYYLSALMGAHIAAIDHQNDDVPYVSPSNKQMKISGLCNRAGEEIALDVETANLLNGQGICTCTNLNGWRSWGNYTAAYPMTTDVKDAFIAERRMFSWWGNTFILTYFQKVDSPMNRRLIESVVDSENIRANGFKARYQIADAHIEYRQEDNPQTDLLSGIIRFHQYLTPFPPAQAIMNTLEFSPDALSAALA